MSLFSISVLIIVGILLFLVEFLIIPGISFAGVGGFLAISGGIFCGYYFHGATIGSMVLLISAVSMSLMFYIAFKYKTWQKLSLTAMVDGKVGSINEETIHKGDEGTTVSKLSPIGNAMINNKIYEVRSNGSYIDTNMKIRIKNIDGNKIYVETI